MTPHLYGVVIRKGAAVKRATVTAEDLERAFGKAAVMCAGDRWCDETQELTLWVRRIHSPHDTERGDG